MTRLVGVLAVLVVAATPWVAAQQSIQPQVYVALIERGPAWPEGKSARELPDFSEHLQHLRALGEHRVGAGPFATQPGESLVGMLVLIAHDQEEAQKLAERDPFVVAKYTQVKVRRWQVDSLKGCF